MKLSELFEKQEKFNERLAERSKRSKKELVNSLILNLFVETGEFANELPFFKYWKEEEIIEDKMLEEFVDILLIWVSVACVMGFNKEKLIKTIIKKIDVNNERQDKGY